jgi:hypothetical protein
MSMLNYQLFVDLGMSGTKATMSNGTKFQSYLCPSRVADLPPSELQILREQGAQFGGGLESGAYLQLGDTAYALADDAEGRSNKTTAMLRKSTLAYLRILGVAGEMAHRFKVPALAIDLGVALPFDEYLSDQHEVIRALQESRHFVYRGREIELVPQVIKVLPEGAGLVQWRKIQAAKRGETNQTYVVVMVGYRDLTFLVFRQGKPPTGEPSSTVKLGYLECLQSIAQGICKPESSYLLDALLNGRDTVAFPDQPGKVFELSDRRQKAEAYYWEQVRHHLSDKFAALDVPRYEVLVGGGTALTELRPQLEPFLSNLPGATINWMPELSREVATTLRVPTESSQARFADCFGGAKWLVMKFAQAAEVA